MTDVTLNRFERLCLEPKARRLSEVKKIGGVGRLPRFLFLLWSALLNLGLLTIALTTREETTLLAWLLLAWVLFLEICGIRINRAGVITSSGEVRVVGPLRKHTLTAEEIDCFERPAMKLPRARLKNGSKITLWGVAWWLAPDYIDAGVSILNQRLAAVQKSTRSISTSAE